MTIVNRFQQTLAAWQSLIPSRPVLALVSALVLVGMWTPVIFTDRSDVTPLGRYWWIADDMFISMRYAHNLASGLGLVWNPGERVEGFTNFLWTLYMAGIHLLAVPPSQTALWILLTNLALGVLTVLVLSRFVQAMGGDRLAQIAVLAALVLNRDVMAWALLGFETTLLTLLVVLATLSLFQDARANHLRAQSYAWVALVTLVRADAFVLSALLCAWAWLIHSDKRRAFIYATVAFIPFAAFVLFRWVYYGDLLPNTAYLKTMFWSTQWIAGLRYGWEFFSAHWVVIALATSGIVITKDTRRRWLLGLLIVYSAYVVYVGGDSNGYFRFFTPIIPILIALAFVGIQHPRVPHFVQVAILLIALASIPLINPVTFPFRRPPPTAQGNLEISLLIAKNTAPTARIADFMVGSTFYFSNRYGIDLLGKVDAHVARQPAHPQVLLPGHNKWDLGYSLALKPDVIAVSFSMPADETKLLNPTIINWNTVFTPDLYFNSIFREHCLPNPVPLQTSRALFICDWSPEFARRNEWRALNAP